MDQAKEKTAKSIKDEENAATRLIFEIIETDYPSETKELHEIFMDVRDLFQGRWPSHEACQTSYHNLDHSLDVTLAAARMVSGWNRIHNSNPIPPAVFKAGLTAALLHDSGYIKNKNDHEGKGGKFTFSHVKRGMDLARIYLTSRKWPADLIGFTIWTISITEFLGEPDLSLYNESDPCSIMGRIVASADLVAQMADVNYIESLKSLYEEFLEAYEYEGIENLKNRSLITYDSFHDLLAGTLSFYRDFVLPRMVLLGRIDQYLIPFFGNGRNPYQENITANISTHFFSKQAQWKKLGEVLEELDLVSREEVDDALRIQEEEKQNLPDNNFPSTQNRIFNWIEKGPSRGRCLGVILMDMGVVDPGVLREGLLAQVFHPESLQALSRQNLLSLLQVVNLTLNARQDPWILEQILAMINEILSCESATLMLINPKENKMIEATCSPASKNRLQNRDIPLDKGLPGWVFRHGRPAIVNENQRQNLLANSHGASETRSILAVPLHIMGEFVGVIELTNKKDDKFTENDVNFMTILANILAISLDQLTFSI